jgi:hypothetical protein
MEHDQPHKNIRDIPVPKEQHLGKFLVAADQPGQFDLEQVHRKTAGGGGQPAQDRHGQQQDVEERMHDLAGDPLR